MRNSAGALVLLVKLCFSSSYITPVSLALYVCCKCLMLAKRRILKTIQILKVSSPFDICSFVQISRNLAFFPGRKMCYILGNKPSTPEKFWYSMHHTIFCSHKMFYLFFFIRTGGNKMSASSK